MKAADPTIRSSVPGPYRQVCMSKQLATAQSKLFATNLILALVKVQSQEKVSKAHEKAVLYKDQITAQTDRFLQVSSTVANLADEIDRYQSGERTSSVVIQQQRSDIEAQGASLATAEAALADITCQRDALQQSLDESIVHERDVLSANSQVCYVLSLTPACG